MMCHRIGLLPISIIGFGRMSVSSLIRVPAPPARITAFMRDSGPAQGSVPRGRWIFEDNDCSGPGGPAQRRGEGAEALHHVPPQGARRHLPGSLGLAPLRPYRGEPSGRVALGAEDRAGLAVE